VLFVTRKWRPAIGGMEEYSHALTDELGKRTRLTIRALPGREDGSPPSSSKLIGFGIGTAWCVARNARHFDVLHFGDLALWPLAIVARLFNRNASVVASAHGTDIAYPLRRGVAPMLYGLYLKLGAFLGRGVRIIANSRATAELVAAAGFSVCATVPLAVRTPALIREAGPASPSVLFVGRLARRKGCRWFIENVLPRLSEQFRFVVAGTPWDAEETAALDNERVTFLGPIRGEALADLRRKATVVVMPNVRCEGRDFEGFGLTAVETAAQQGVLLASALDGIVDAVVDGVTGFLLPAEEAAAWASKIEEIAAWSESTRQRFVLDAFEYVRGHFNWTRVVEQTLAAYAPSRVSGPQARES